MRSRVLFAGVMMAFGINSVVRGYHIYKDIGVLKLIQSYCVVQSLVIVKTGSYAVAVMNGTHVPRKISFICHLFLRHFFVGNLFS